MSGFVAILLWFVIMAIFAYFVDVDEEIVVNGKKTRTVKLWYAILVFLPIVYMAVYRDAYWQDTGIYIAAYKGFPSSIGGFFSALSEVKKDKAFYALGMLTKIFISKDYHAFFFIIATFQTACLIKLFREHSSSFLFSVFIFWISTDCISWMLNGVRQFTAVCICFLATTWMINRKYVPAIIAVLIASLFHQSALLMIPIFLAASDRLVNYKMIFIIAVVIFAVLYTDRFTNVLETLLEDTQYTNVVDDWTIGQDDGTNPIRVLVYSVPTVLSLLGKRYIEEENSPIITFSANTSVISTCIYIISMFTSGIYIGRLPIYASLYATCILLPWEIENMFNTDSVRMLKVMMYFFYLLFYFYQMHVIWGLI